MNSKLRLFGIFKQLCKNANGDASKQFARALSSLLTQLQCEPSASSTAPPQKLVGNVQFVLRHQFTYAAVDEKLENKLDSQAHTGHYSVVIVTGDIRGSGTSSRAWIQLIGEYGASSLLEVGVNSRGVPCGFDQGSTHTYEFDIPEILGEIRRVYVMKDRHHDEAEHNSGWFLAYVQTSDPEGRVQRFPCGQWLGHNVDGEVAGALDRNLAPAADLDDPNSAIEVQLDQPLDVKGSGFVAAHPDKAKAGVRSVAKRDFGYGGEDAYFFVQGRQRIVGCGVADGVYQWKEVGIDSGHYSRALMQTAQKQVGEGNCDALKAMQVAYRGNQSEGVYGSSTICILTINTLTGSLNSAYLGDSGFVVIGRDERWSDPVPASELLPPEEQLEAAGTLQWAKKATQLQRYKVKYASPQQEHEFGRPYQLGHHQYADTPEDAMLAQVQVAPSDVIIVGTDGLFDNVSEQHILQHASLYTQVGMPPGTIAQSLTRLAFNTSLDRHAVTPYALAASEARNMVYMGGKRDDITVVVLVAK